MILILISISNPVTVEHNHIGIEIESMRMSDKMIQKLPVFSTEQQNLVEVTQTQL